tara:strand:- start:45 stop:383 length:339 start_codon:yes stop_codon:yes gene_type:complete
MPRRVGRYTKQETTELLKMFEEGYSIYKICRNINRSQKSIRNNLIRLGKIKGEITPKRYVVEGKDVIIEDENHLFEYFKYFSILSIIIFAMIVNPLLNPIEILMNYIYLVYN